jgi:outer membrane biosynthesis protein TonB
MADENVLSQADIDALLAAAPPPKPSPAKVEAVYEEPEEIPKPLPKVVTKPKPRAPVEPVETIAPHPAPVSTYVPRKEKGSSNEVEYLNSKMTDLTNRLARAEITISELNQTIKGLSQSFRCDACNSQGFVAFYVKCTDCGKGKWWGWWPKK